MNIKDLDIDQLLDQFRFMIVDEQEESWQKEPEEKRIADCQEIIKKGFKDLLSQSKQEILGRVDKEVIGVERKVEDTIDLIINKTRADQRQKLEQLQLKVKNKE